MSTWQEKAQAKRESLLAAIPPEWRLAQPAPPAEEQRDITGTYLHQFLNPQEIEITETDAVGIVARTSTGQWKAEDVARAFCHRAALAHQILNCLHEIFFDAALSDARAADAYLATHGKPMGPLHGLPISLKDQMHVKGVPTSMGYIGWLDLPPHPRESLMVTTLRSLGAILYVKTACPQTLISGETQNNIIDYTWNPANRLLSCGGSSGGEAALIACKGSPLGMGTDYTGSIRIPSAFCGIFGLRPSGGRMSYQDMANSMDGQNSMLSVVGPMGGSPRDLALIMRSVLATEPWLHDPLVNEIPWRSELEQEARNLIDAAAAPGKPRLAFGLLRHDGSVRPHPPIARALDIVADALTKQGHAVIPWEPPNHARADIIGMTTWVYDGGADVHKAFALSGEPVSEQIQRVYGTQPSNQMTGEQINANNVAKREFQREYAAYWNGTVAATGTGRPVDAVILPQAAHAAARPKMYFYAGYTTVGSVLDYPTVIVPVTRVDKSVDIADTTYQGVGEMDSLVWSTYDPEIYHGAPVCLQLMARKFKDEKLLVLAEHVAEEVQKITQAKA